VHVKFTVYYKTSAMKELERLPKNAQQKIVESIVALERGDFYKVEKLQGYDDYYRSKRAWPYRILFVVEESVIRITHIVHRQGAYK